MQNKLEKALKEVFEDVHLEEAEILPSGHLCGYVVSGDFCDLDHVDRREKLRQALDKLSMDDRLQISTLLTMTPEEWTVDLKEQ